MSNVHQFSAVEEMDEAARAAGWDMEYRQFGKGEFRAEFASIEIDEILFASERFNNHLCIDCEPPTGFTGLFLPGMGLGHLQVCGRALTDGTLIALPPLSEMDFVTRNTICNETIFLPARDLDAAARAIAPSAELLTEGTATIFNGKPEHLAALRREISLLTRKDGIDSEEASNMLAKVITWMTDASSQTKVERLTRGAAARTARSARSFIEENFQDVIRLQDLCKFTGVSLRTLQRSFESYFQTSPLDYIKMRRLNAVRRELVAADPSRKSVTSLATKYGFSHLGRFSIDYRRHFGELPSMTLAARRSPRSAARRGSCH